MHTPALSLLPFRRSLSALGHFIVVVQVGLTLLANRPDLNSKLPAFLGLLLVVVISVSLSSTARRLPLLFLPTIYVVILAFISDGPQRWINLNVSLMAGALVFGICLRPLLAASSALVLSFVWIYAVKVDLPSIIQAGPFLAGGAFHVIQMTAAATIFSYTWARLDESALAREAEDRTISARDMTSRLRRDRFRQWRRTSARLQGGTLAVLQDAYRNGMADHRRLDESLAALRVIRDEVVADPGAVVQLVSDDIGPGIEFSFTGPSSPDLQQITPGQADLLYAVLNEFAISARQASASAISVIAHRSDARWLFVITEEQLPLRGRRDVLGDLSSLREQLRLANASLSISSSGGPLALTLVIPDEERAPHAEPVADVDPRWAVETAGERALAAGLLGVPVATLVLALGLQDFWPGSMEVSVVAALLAASLLAAFFRTKVRLSGLESLVISAIAIALLVLMTWYRPSCQNILPSHYLVTLSGYALIIVAFLGNRAVGYLSVLPWLVAAIGLIHAVPDGCESVVWIGIVNTLVFTPIGLVLWWLALRAFRALEVRRAQRRRTLAVVSQREQMLEDTVFRVEGLLRDAQAVLAQLQGQPHDPELIARLRVLEAQLRVRMQIDPVLGGSLARSMVEFVDLLAEQGKWVSVGPIASSGYQRALTTDFENGAESLAQVMASGRRVQFLTTEEDELVTVTLSRAEADGLIEQIGHWEMTASGWKSGDIYVDLDLAGSDDPEAPVLLLVSRRIEMVPGLGIPDRRAIPRPAKTP